MSGHVIPSGAVKGHLLASYRSEPFPTPCRLIGRESGLAGESVGTECEPKTALVCRSGCRCLQAATGSQRHVAADEEPTPDQRTDAL